MGEVNILWYDLQQREKERKKERDKQTERQKQTETKTDMFFCATNDLLSSVYNQPTKTKSRT